MAARTTIKHKRKAGAFTTGQLSAGEIGVDTTNGDLYFSTDGTDIHQIDVSAVGGGLTYIGDLQSTVAQLAYELAILQNVSFLSLVDGPVITYDDATAIDTGSSSNYSHDPTTETVSNVTRLDTTFTKASTYWGLPDYTTIQLFTAAQIPQSGSKIRFKLSGNASGAHTIGDCYISQQATSGDAFDSHSDITRVTFNGGNNSVTLGINEEIWSDWITYTVDATKNHLLSVYTQAGGSIPYRSDAAHTVYYKPGNDAVTQNRTGYSSVGYITSAFVIEVATDPLLMTLVSVVWNATASPATASFTMRFNQPNSDVTVDTDIRVEVSRDGKTTWTFATLTEIRTEGTTTICKGTVDLSGQPSGTALHTRITTPGGTPKEVQIEAHTLQVE